MKVINIQTLTASLIMLCMTGCKSQPETSNKLNSSATYAVPNIIGDLEKQAGDEIVGVHLKYESAILYPDSADSELHFKWEGINAGALGEDALFRLSLASDLVTFQKLMVFTAENKLIDSIDLSLGTPFQLLQCKIPAEFISDVLAKGLKVRLKGKGGLVGVFVKTAADLDNFLPHLLVPGNQTPNEEFLNRMASLACLTAYGWQEGCVIDGLARLATKAQDGKKYKNALKNHLGLIFPRDDTINHSYENLGIEFTSCLAQLALSNPNHPEIEHVLNFWNSRIDSLGIIMEGNRIVAEGNYTVAWPMAVISRQLNRPDLAEEAIRQLRLRRKYLVDEQGAMWLRYNFKTRERTYKLWSRGLTWYFLGLAKTLDALPNPPRDLIEELQRASGYLISVQGDDGMWNVFADDSATSPETSGTSGIATAMAIGVRREWLGEKAESSARLALQGLEKRLTPDGYLTNVAEANRGGIAFQYQTKGSICQWGMGLYAQLLAELAPPEH
ncbi:MAG: hypothetical protein GVY19_13920 [Bacteroidetes bacterium]|nr:hypothetical protein [Bacteroidota bacterium]